ncbi:hypothetical protein [Acidiphilium acidophilum]|uniref:Uncharacterized protein n=1 Tax=Acidiphilium acidophilum TaxID=76588 RepID=A0AAW9DN49_ACIAO|nr:hypothetical protein [Acidiphilium acidophilum]MDX5930504.1 hypothetical protein [Acidiphilium acidophilum]
MTSTATETLLALAARIARLGPYRRDPERYHVEKSEIAAELRRLARNPDPPRKIIPNSHGRTWTV